jgi:hypothetical protein
MSNACQKCGAPVSSGAFLGLCPACSQGDQASANLSSSPGGGRPKWVKPVIIAAAVFALLAFVAVFTLYTASAPEKSRAPQIAPVQSR